MNQSNQDQAGKPQNGEYQNGEYQNGEQPNDSSDERWDAIYRRLDAVQQRITQSGTSTVAQQRATLKARAKEMARKPLHSREDALEPELEIVEFRMAHETYGFESRFIREVYPLKDYCPVPCTPDFVLGLVNVRGQLLSVLNLKKFFGLASQELDNHNQAIILQHTFAAHSFGEDELGGHNPFRHDSIKNEIMGRNDATGRATMEIGVLADALLNVSRVARQSLQTDLPTLTGLRQEFLLGITPQRVIVLDAEKLLSSREIIVYEEVEN